MHGMLHNGYWQVGEHMSCEGYWKVGEHLSCKGWSHAWNVAQVGEHNTGRLVLEKTVFLHG